MRKIKLFCLSAALIVLLASCASEEAQSEGSIDVTAAPEQDIQDEEPDLNSLKPEDMYTELFAMRVAPEDYPDPGTPVRVIGRFEVYDDEGDTVGRLTDAKLSE